MTPLVPIDLLRCADSAPPRPDADHVAAEEPLEIRVAGQNIAVTMRTPGHDRELAAGFLVTEGILRTRADVVDMTRCEGGVREPSENLLDVILTPGVAVDFESLSRHVFASSSCGICGKATIESVRGRFPPVGPGPRIAREVLYALPDRLKAAQETFRRTGGLHAAGLFDPLGNLLVLREDVGRHNAVDKAVGWAFFENRLPLAETVLMVSGRSSFEIMQKALAAGIPAVAAVSAPSSLAVSFARESNQTLVGFLRGRTMNIYSHPERLEV